MKMLETDALFRALVVEDSGICNSLFNLRNQTDSDDFFKRGLVCSQYLNCAQGRKRSRPQAVSLSFSKLTLQTFSLGSFYLNQEPSRFGERGTFV